MLFYKANSDLKSVFMEAVEADNNRDSKRDKTNSWETLS